MISIDKLVSIGFTVSQATDISKFFRSIGYAAKFAASDLVDGVTVPANKILKLDPNIDTLKATFKADTQFYKDLSVIIQQIGNMKPNKSNASHIVVYQVSESDYGTAVDNFVKVNANWAQLLIDSREVTDIDKAATKAKENSRLFIGQTNDETISSKGEGNIAEKQAKLSNDNFMLFYHPDIESLAHGAASIGAQSQLGSVGVLYSTVTSVTPQDYSPTIMTNLDELKVGYYSEVNPINGGGVSEYASPIVWGGYMINGEDAKRKYIRFALDLLLKAKSIDFLKKKLTYEDISSKILDSMLSSVLVEAQINGLVKKDTETKKGFELIVTPPSVLQETEPTLYNSETYKVVGYYRDAKTGRRVQIDLYIDPTEAELSQLLGMAA